ncbi:MAG TPA: Xaa-Pro peptidase family protein [bacterium]|nr:Xaa-Pro peptidase family protein [bacterium]HNT65379.1 Xaa-Pro peptidase family protein [bacterium]
MVGEKIEQAAKILQEKNIDLWLTFARETSSNPDPVLDLILGAHCTWPSAIILFASGEKIAIVGSLDMQNIRDHAPYQVIGYRDSIRDELLGILHKHDPKTIAVNYSTNDVMADGLTHGMYLMLTEYLAATPYIDRLCSSEAIIAALRGRKSTGEIERIRAAIKETLQIFDLVAEKVRCGMSEKEVASLMVEAMQARGLAPAWDPDHCPAVFTGPDTAGAHAGPTDRPIQPGHIMNIDFGVRKDGYVSDLQRTFYFLRPGEVQAPEAVQHGFNVIRDAIQMAAAALKPGVEGWMIDQVARDYIVSQGYEEYPHALGHQVGRSAHDGSALLCPRWERYKNLPFLPVEAGQVYTLEPRLNVKGAGIATIEEIVVVHESGCKFLSEPQKELITIKSA